MNLSLTQSEGGGAQQALSPPRLFPPKSVAQACSPIFPPKLGSNFPAKTRRIFFPSKSEAYFSRQNQKHIFPPKSEAYCSRQNPEHIFPAKIRSIFSRQNQEHTFPAKFRSSQYGRLPDPSVQFASFPGQPSINPSIPCSCCYLVIALY